MREPIESRYGILGGKEAEWVLKADYAELGKQCEELKQIALDLSEELSAAEFALSVEPSDLHENLKQLITRIKEKGK
jgi:hypothetical protein